MAEKRDLRRAVAIWLILAALAAYAQADPNKASNPYPPDGATDVPAEEVVLCWTPGLGVGTMGRHFLYFGTDPNAVDNAGPGDPEYVDMLPADVNCYYVGDLVLGTAYCWRVDEFNEDLSTTKGDLWCFNIERPPTNFEPTVKSRPWASPCDCEECAKPGETEGVGDPIYAFSGEYYKSVVDLRIKGRGLDFIWARKYRSRIGPNTVQGNKWDFSYNIKIERDGGNFRLGDGNTRRDTYSLQGGGTWAADGFFRELAQDDPNDSNSSFTMGFSDTGTWSFSPLNDSNAAGKISASTDRNGNTLSFDYDAQGRLVTIHDTLDTEAHNRDITIAYNADGFIESVTDWTGRQVRYEYYQDGDAGGSFGDLKSVTTPAVTGTPTGNDFPAGKTTTYTYSKGSVEEALNHNLLTITDPKGQTVLTNIYASTEDPEDPNFDRVVRQIWGDPCDIIDLTYVPQTPSEQNNFAVIKTIVNDRVGNVKEYFYDSSNQLVIRREYTGRADPNLPTTETQNRPTGQLRPGDPSFFETRRQYNEDSLPTRIDYSNGNSVVNVYELELDPNAPPRSRGNLREVHRFPGPLGGDQAEIVELFEYDMGVGCCGTNFVTRHVDSRGNETLHAYDQRGNRLHTQHRIGSVVEDFRYNEFGQMTWHILPDNGSGHRRVDVYIYHSSSLLADLSGNGCVNFLDLAIFASFWREPGNSVADIFPPGGDGVVDERDLKTFVSEWLVCLDPNSPNPQNGYLKSSIIDANNLALTTAYEHDAVGNLVRETDPRGRDTEFVVNQLNQVVRSISREVTDGSGIRYQRDTYYDENNNIIRVNVQNMDDQGVLQPNTHFTTTYEYDILNYLTRQTQEVYPVDNIVTEYEYDGNRNRTLVHYGEATNGNQPANTVRTLYDERDLVFREIRAEGDPNQSTTQYDYDGNGNRTKVHRGLEQTPRTTVSGYDGYDRLVSSTDPMGNVTTSHYDENHNRTSEQTDGELIDVAGDANNVRLWAAAYVYDDMDRLIRTEVGFFDPNTQVDINDGNSVTEYEYSDNSQVVLVINDNNHPTATAYDTANRLSVITDAKGNTATYSYDRNSNVIAITEVEKSDLAAPDEEFTTTYAYDGLDRLIQTTDNVGNTHTYAYDSRDNRTQTIDALSHETRYEYDGLDRLTETIRDLDGDGADGDGDDITTSQTWDDTSRLVAQTDDNGNTTSYEYDALNRMFREQMADATVHSYTYDVHDNRLTMTDADGSVSACTYDLLDRLTDKTIAPGPGVSNDTTFESYAYDGLSRLVAAEDDDSVVTRSYDSLSRVTCETLNGRTTTCVYDGVGNQTQCTYPGGRVITCTYDDLERKKTISDPNGIIAAYDYIGPDRVERREFGNGTRTDYTYDGIIGIPNPPGDFGVKRIVRTAHSKISDGTIIDDRTYTWDPMYNKTQRKDVRAGWPGLTHDYTYDSVYRLVHTTVTCSYGAVVRDTDYDLDGVGNRNTVVGAPDAGPHVGPYTMDPTQPEPADFQMNQYTTTSFDARLYDKNGNLIRIDDALPTQRDIGYDYRNQMVEVNDTNTGQVHTYSYDALGRRIERVVDSTGTPQSTRYFYHGWQVVEEQDANGLTQATYVYGNYIDEVLNMQRDANDYFYHTDDLYNVMAVTDSNGTAVERYEYLDYGQPIDPITLAPIPGDPSAIGNPYMFTGRRFDSETGWYYYRNRYVDSLSGSFTVREIYGTWYDSSALGNGHVYAGCSPLSFTDPSGTEVVGRNTFGSIEWAEVGGGEVQITFKGDHHQVCCLELAFVQAVRVIVVATGADLNLGAHMRADQHPERLLNRRTPAGWWIDRNPVSRYSYTRGTGRTRRPVVVREPLKYAWYGRANNGEAMNNFRQTGSTAWMTDRPRGGPPGTRWFFETCAVCKKGKKGCRAQDNQVYGCITWHFDVGAGGAPIFPAAPGGRDHDNAPSPNFTAAVRAWNAQAAGPPPGRQHPHQVPLGPFEPATPASPW
jgi:RHS repeat-associated protein